jgi:hypothetical protein
MSDSNTQDLLQEIDLILPRSYYLKYDSIIEDHRSGRVFLTRPSSNNTNQPTQPLSIEDSSAGEMSLDGGSTSVVAQPSTTTQKSTEPVYYFTKATKNIITLYEPAPLGNEWSAIGSSRRLITIVPDG